MNHCRFECWSEKIQRIVSKEKTLEKKVRNNIQSLAKVTDRDEGRKDTRGTSISNDQID